MQWYMRIEAVVEDRRGYERSLLIYDTMRTSLLGGGLGEVVPVRTYARYYVNSPANSYGQPIPGYQPPACSGPGGACGVTESTLAGCD